MKNLLLTLSLLLCLVPQLAAQEESQLLPDGIVFPRLTNAEMQANTAVQGQCVYNVTFSAIFCYDGNIWRNIDTTNSFNERVFDNDLDTGIETALDPDDDILRFYAGTIDEVMRHDGKTLHILNTGESVFIGEEAGKFDDGSDNRNTSVGHHAGQLTTAGSNNVAVGNQALRDNATGNNNVAIGKQALFKSTQSNNIGIGLNAGLNSVTGNKNTMVGGYAGANNATGNENTLLGYEAGRSVSGQNPTGNIMIGHQAGMNETDSDRLYIANDATDAPLVYGEFDESILRVNGNLQVNDPLQDGYDLPAMDGDPLQVLTTDGNGTVQWANAGTSTTFAGGAAGGFEIDLDQNEAVPSSSLLFHWDIPGIEGDSNDNVHGDEIVCYGYDHSLTTTSFSNSGGGVNNNTPCGNHIFIIRKAVDKASPLLRQKQVNGATLGDEVKFSVKKVGTSQDIIIYTLDDVLIEQIETRVIYDTNDKYRLFEFVKLIFNGPQKMEYFHQNPNGSFDQEGVEFSYDCVIGAQF